MSKGVRFKRGVHHRVLNAEGSNARLAQQYWSPTEQYHERGASREEQIAALTAHRIKLLKRLDHAMGRGDNTKAIKFINLIADASAKISLLMGSQYKAPAYRPSKAQLIRDLG